MVLSSMRATIWSKVAHVLVVGANRSATSAVISAYVSILWGGRGLEAKVVIGKKF